ncbi:unnamed protein product [Rotaria magnacalcarata]|uniref:EGF-like domain-containing protein n=2 Tax=Rotaria magnacalcarata TaxID=392030 RepID=A0A816P7E9_9BILA|nr:unnamed protein product [Rotaria magnacalcarata]CAF2045002.1 unnamed protein product [Rotaria magnacalcarata]CAF2155855.1 unnamed protein product [Rotaria magnacalcarata]
MPGPLEFCLTCETKGHGRCIRNSTFCQCLEGYTGLLCTVESDELSSTIPMAIDYERRGSPIINTTAIVAAILGGFLLMMMVGVLIFWFLRRKYQTKTLLTDSSSIPTDPTPALYNVPLSQRNSVTSAKTYHIYEYLR